MRIIVDVVANHMTATWNAIADRWKSATCTITTATTAAYRTTATVTR
ncbi:MAG: hypothetical protein ACLU2U_03975 [Bifidobacterium angulatum]